MNLLYPLSLCLWRGKLQIYFTLTRVLIRHTHNLRVIPIRKVQLLHRSCVLPELFWPLFGAYAQLLHSCDAHGRHPTLGPLLFVFVHLAVPVVIRVFRMIYLITAMALHHDLAPDFLIVVVIELCFEFATPCSIY